MTDDNNDLPTVDRARMCLLDNGWAAVQVIYPDGEEWPWLIGGDPDGEQGCMCSNCCPHEQVTPARLETT